MYETQTSRAEASGNGVTTLFPVTLQLYDVSHLQVWRHIPATEELALLVRGTDYLASVNADFMGAQVQFVHDVGGGQVVFAPPTGHNFVFLRVVPYKQSVDLKTYGLTDMDALERQLDLLAMALSQLDEELTRAVKVNVAGVETNPDALLASLAASVSAAGASATSASGSASAANSAKLAAQAAQAAAEAAAASVPVNTDSRLTALENADITLAARVAKCEIGVRVTTQTLCGGA